MADSFLDVDPIQLGTPSYAEAPLDPTTSGLPTLGAYSTNLILEKPTSILPALLSSTFNIPSVTIDAQGIMEDVNVDIPDIDTVNEEAEKEGIDPVDWADENIVKPIDQNVVRPIDQAVEDYIVDPATTIIKDAAQDVKETVVDPTVDVAADITKEVKETVVDPTLDVAADITKEVIIEPTKKVVDPVLDSITNKLKNINIANVDSFTTPKFIKDLEKLGGEFYDSTQGINNFKNNPNSATALEFLDSLDRIYGLATGTPEMLTTLPEIEIEGVGTIGGDTIQGSSLFTSEQRINFQNAASLYSIGSYIENPTVEGTAGAYGSILHLTNPASGVLDNPQIYEALGGDKVAGLVDNAGNLVAVYNALEALEGGVEGVGEALTVASGFASGATLAGFTQFAGIAGPLALGAMAIMLATSDQDFPRAFASIEYDSEYSYQSGYYGYKDELNPSGNYIYALDELTGKNSGGYGPFKYGEGRAIDGGDRSKTDSSLMASQEFANWMVTGLGYEVDEAAFKKFAEDGSNFVGSGDIGYLQAKHGYKGIKKDGYELTVDMINKGVFVKTDDTVVLDPEDWKTSLAHLKEAQGNSDSFLYKKLADISDPIKGELREEINSIKQNITQSATNIAERQKEFEENPDLAAEEIKNTLIQGVFDAKGSLEDKISAVENIIAVDTQAIINSAFDPMKAMQEAYGFKSVGIPEDPYTRTQESAAVSFSGSPFGFYGTLPYIG